MGARHVIPSCSLQRLALQKPWARRSFRARNDHQSTVVYCSGREATHGDPKKGKGLRASFSPKHSCFFDTWLAVPGLSFFTVQGCGESAQAARMSDDMHSPDLCSVDPRQGARAAGARQPSYVHTCTHQTPESVATLKPDLDCGVRTGTDAVRPPSANFLATTVPRPFRDNARWNIAIVDRT